MTPFGLVHMHKMSPHIPTILIVRKCMVLARAVKPKMLSNYVGGLLRFMQLCNALNIPEYLHMLTPKWLLSNFITTRHPGTVGGRPLKTWLLGLELWHVNNSMPWRGGSHLKCTVQGSKTVAPPTSCHQNMPL